MDDGCSTTPRVSLGHSGNLTVIRSDEHKTLLVCWICKFIVTIGLMSGVFANCPGDRCSISGRIIPETQKWYLMPPCLTLNIIRQWWRVKCGNPLNVIQFYLTHRWNPIRWGGVNLEVMAMNGYTPFPKGLILNH